MTRDEIEAAEHRLERALDRGVWNSDRVGEYRSGKANWLADCALVARARILERAERQRRIEAAAEELDSVLTELTCVASPESRQAAIARIITKHWEQS